MMRLIFGSGPLFQSSKRVEDRLGAGLPALDPVGAAAGLVVLQPGQRPGVLRRRVLLREFRIDDERHHDGDVEQQHLVLADVVDAEGVVVDHDELLRLLQRARRHLEGRKAADLHRAVERPFHVLGGDRRAVVEFRVLAQLEGAGHAVGCDLPAFGKLGRELFAVVGRRAVRKRLRRIGQQPVVAIPGRPLTVWFEPVCSRMSVLRPIRYSEFHGVFPFQVRKENGCAGYVSGAGINWV